MPVIEPFRALRYNLSASELEKVLAPPYDVISPDEREELYSRDPHNVVRLVLGREADPYAEAARFLKEWRDEAILRFDEKPAFYVLQQEFHAMGGTRVRTGLIARCKLEPSGAKGLVLPHEKTLSAPKEDRLKLLQATATQYSQIFGILEDPNGEFQSSLTEIACSAPDLELNFDSVLHRLWIVPEAEIMRKISEKVASSHILIADGHHRFETAFQYRLWRRKRENLPSPHAVDFTMMYLTSERDSGLVVLPTHRLVFGLFEFSSDRVLNHLRNLFILTPISDSIGDGNVCNVPDKSLFVLVLDSGCYAVEQKPQVDLWANTQIAEPLRNLSLMVLHGIVLEQILGVTRESQVRKEHIDYTKDVDEVISRVRSGRAQIGFIVKPVSISEIFAVAKAGLTMPQKSTYFYPKLPSGLVMYSMES